MSEQENTLNTSNKIIAVMLCCVFLFPFQLIAELNQRENIKKASTEINVKNEKTEEISDNETKTGEILIETPKDSVPNEIENSILELESAVINDTIESNKIIFNPDPNRAVWLSALFPGLGQIYNRRYWKLPIVAGGFMGISYALSWNNRMYSDYTTAYRDAMDNDPGTKSYLDFFHSNVKEEDIDMTWLKKTLKSRKDFYRRNRDLSIICMVGMYILCMVDAYVDASLSHFDISPNLSMDVAPAIIEGNRNGVPSIGLHWALSF